MSLQLGQLRHAETYLQTALQYSENVIDKADVLDKLVCVAATDGDNGSLISFSFFFLCHLLPAFFLFVLFFPYLHFVPRKPEIRIQESTETESRERKEGPT